MAAKMIQTISLEKLVEMCDKDRSLPDDIVVYASSINNINPEDSLGNSL